MNSMRGLVDLPNELLLHVLEIGRVNLFDAFALHETCHRLHNFSETHSFWTSVVETAVAAGDVLPFPPFQESKDLSVSELKRMCAKHCKSVDNLSSAEPEYRTWWTIDTNRDRQISWVLCLSDGAYCFVFYDDGMIEVWDTKPKVEQDRSRSRSGRPVGSCLGYVDTEDVGEFLGDFDVKDEDHGIVVDFVMLSEIDHGQANLMTVWRLRIEQEVSGHVLAHQRMGSFATEWIEKISICGGLVACLWSPTDEEGVQPHIAILDYCTGTAVYLATCIHWQGNICDLSILSDGGLIWYTCRKTVDIYLYENIRSLLSIVPDHASSPPIESIPPHHHKTYNLPESDIPNPPERSVLSSWGICGIKSNARHRLLPIVLQNWSESLASNGIEGMIEAVYLDLALLQGAFKSGASESPVIYGARCDITQVTISKPFIGERGLHVGTCGQHLALIENLDPVGSNSKYLDFKLLPLYPRNRSLLASGDFIAAEPRCLRDVPVDLSDIECVTFLDEASTLILVTKTLNEGGRIIHFIEY